MLRKQFELVWNQLRPKKAQLSHYLESVHIKGMRGISDLRVVLPYPVSVLAGPNGCGKTTVLFGAACAYLTAPPGQIRPSPASLFPDFRTAKQGLPQDTRGESAIEFVAVDEGNTVQFQWARRPDGRWKRRPKGANPTRVSYVRTLADLTNPAEIRSVLQMGRQDVNSAEVSASLLAFAQRILPNRYRAVLQLSTLRRDLFFATLEGGASYSEFHMASGERVVLRLSRELSELRDALVLIDEVDVGLHPFTQQQLMLELQRLALRNGLQIIVTTHSPVILEAVPEEARIFLEREGENVIPRPTYRDVLQRAMYGRPLERLHVLCEDRVAKSVILGVMDVLNPALNLSGSDVDIGHNTGKDEFAHHVRALGRFQQLSSFAFVLDGDGKSLENDLKTTAADMGQPLQILFFPGDSAPEEWIWRALADRTSEYAGLLNLDAALLTRELDQVGRVFQAATDKPAEIAKHRLATLLEGLGHDIEAVCRVVGRREAEGGVLTDFRQKLHDLINLWRSREG